MYYVNLPILSSSIKEEINAQANTMALLPEHYSGSIYKDRNCCYTEIQEFTNNKAIEDLLLPILKKTFESFVLVCRNNNLNYPSEFPPHFDDSRALSLNYLIETGGNNVQTSFYDLERPVDDIELIKKNIPHEGLVKTSKYILQKDKWNLSNTQICHSVENISTTRVILFIMFVENTKYADFIKNFSDRLTEIPNFLNNNS